MVDHGLVCLIVVLIKDFHELEVDYCGYFQSLELGLKPLHSCLVEIELSRLGRCDLPLSPPIHRMEGAASHDSDPLYIFFVSS